MYEDFMLESYVEQPEFLSYCSRKPILTYRADPDLFSDSLFIYGLNEEKQCVIYTFIFSSLGTVLGSIEDEALEKALQKESLTETISVGIVEKSQLNKYFKSLYKKNIEESKKYVLSFCKEIVSDAIYLSVGVKNDEDMDRDVADIASIYMMAGSCKRRKIGIEVLESVEYEDSDTEDDDKSENGEEGVFN